MAERDIHQHIAEGKASERVLEKAKLLDAKLKAVDADAEEQRKLFPPAPAGKVLKADSK